MVTPCGETTPQWPMPPSHFPLCKRWQNVAADGWCDLGSEAEGAFGSIRSSVHMIVTVNKCKERRREASNLSGCDFPTGVEIP